MNQLQIFKNDEFGEVRTTIIDGKPYFCGSDIAKALGYAKPYDAIKQHCEKDDTVSCSITDSLGRTQEAKFITEGNVHRLIVAAAKQSKNKNIQEKAKQYANWIFDVIMPSIRKTGTYSMGDTNVSSIPIGEIASFSKVMIKVMEKQQSHPTDIAESFKCVCEQFGINLPQSFIKKQNHEQMSMILSEQKKSTC